MAEWDFKEMVLDYGNEYLMEYYPDDTVLEMEYFDKYYANHSPLDIVWSVRNGYSWSPNDNIRREFNPNEEYLTFNGYANPVSISESLLDEYLMSRIDEDEFKEWCKDQNYFEEEKVIYIVRDLKDGEIYGEFDNYEDAEAFVENDQNDHNLEIEEYYE